eukprot:TRINITY_DN17232_c0_g1_i2.p1 TRINITY_DN17232_c0_g1~~TRINITY_DN17232_c0_g1_i2.p1  ORF type:complete len:427 (-),score=130.11 TRINITY_DN17232_c0_g1_i2:201-1481(-)
MSLYRSGTGGGNARLSTGGVPAGSRDITYGAASGSSNLPSYLAGGSSGAGGGSGAVVYGNGSQYLNNSTSAGPRSPMQSISGSPVRRPGSSYGAGPVVATGPIAGPSYMPSPGPPLMGAGPMHYGGRPSFADYDDDFYGAPRGSPNYSHALRRRYSSSRSFARGRSPSPDYYDDRRFSVGGPRRSVSRGSRGGDLLDETLSREEAAFRRAKDRQRDIEHQMRRREEEELEHLRKRHEERRREAAARRLYEKEMRKAAERDERIQQEIDARSRRADRVYERLLREGEAIAKETYEKEMRKVEQIEMEHERDRREHLRAVDRDVHDISAGKLRERRLDDDDSYYSDDDDDSRGRGRSKGRGKGGKKGGKGGRSKSKGRDKGSKSKSKSKDRSGRSKSKGKGGKGRSKSKSKSKGKGGSRDRKGRSGGR